MTATLLHVAATIALTAAFIIILLRVCRVFGAVDARPPLTDLNEFERGDCRCSDVVGAHFHDRSFTE